MTTQLCPTLIPRPSLLRPAAQVSSGSLSETQSFRPPTPGLLNQNLHYNRIPVIYMHAACQGLRGRLEFQLKQREASCGGWEDGRMGDREVVREVVSL